MHDMKTNMIQTHRIPVGREHLLAALRERQFRPYLQAIVGPDGTWHGAEILMRWLHPHAGPLPPAVFLTRLMEEGLILSAAKQMLDHVSVAWREAEIALTRPFFLSFNACRSQLQSQSLVQQCEEFTLGLQNPFVSLMIEMPERGADLCASRCTALFDQLSEADVLIAIDDFGIGDARLHQLACGQIHCLKLDRSFVAAMEGNSMYIRLIEKIVALAAVFGTQVTAEGVETRSQWRRLELIGVSLFQGYYFNKPLAAERFFSKM